MSDNIGTVLSGVVLAFVIGTVGMIYNSDKNNEVFATQLKYIALSVTELKTDVSRLKQEIDKNMESRWRRIDHDQYSKQVDERFQRLESQYDRLDGRINRMERRNTR